MDAFEIRRSDASHGRQGSTALSSNVNQSSDVHITKKAVAEIARIIDTVRNSLLYFGENTH